MSESLLGSSLILFTGEAVADQCKDKEAGFHRWATVPGTSPSNVKPCGGDFVGNDRADVMGYNRRNGDLYVGENTGACDDQREGICFSFNKRLPFSRREDRSAWRFVAGDFFFTVGKSAGVLAYNRNTGRLFLLHIRTNASLYTREAQRTIHIVSRSIQPRFFRDSDFSFMTGTFVPDVDAKTDILAYNGRTGHLWVGTVSLTRGTRI